MSSLLFLKRKKKNAEKRLSGSHYPNAKKRSLQFAKKGQLNSGKVRLPAED